MPHLPGPCAGLCPRLCYRFVDGGAALDEESGHFRSSPAAGPAQRGRLEDVVAEIEPRSVIEEHGGEARSFPLVEAVSRGGEVEYGRALPAYIRVNAIF